MSLDFLSRDVDLRCARIADELSRAAGAATVCIGLFDTERGRFDRLWVGDGGADADRLPDSLRSMIRGGASMRRFGPGDPEAADIDWLASGRVLTALGEVRGTRRAVAALIQDEVERAAGPEVGLCRFGLLYAIRVLDDALASRDAGQRNLAESILENLSVNVAVVDPQGGIVYRSRFSDVWLSETCPIDVVRDRLVARSNALQVELREALEAATSSQRQTSMLRIERRNGRCLGAVVAPLSMTPPRALLVFGEDQCDSSVRELLLSAFGLTPAERGVARCLLTGMSISDAAEHLKIKPSSARTYLKRVFSKTGVRRQSELISLYHSIVPPVRFDPGSQAVAVAAPAGRAMVRPRGRTGDASGMMGLDR